MGIFNEDEFVWVVMSRNDCFGFQTSPRFVAKIIYKPFNIGDWWYFTRFGVDFAINPMSSDFIGIESVVKGE